MFEIQHQQFKSARWWHSRREQIDMDPQYQRKGNLWRVEDRQSLIDTMINGYDMPKLYLTDFTTIKTDLNSAGLRYAVVDGKQRLAAIFSFLSNEMPLSKEFRLEENPSLRLAGMYFRDLREIGVEFAERVEEFPLPIVHVVADDAARIRELFLRLNKGLVLTGPEKRNAMVGSVPEAITEIAGHEFFERSTAYKADRGQNENNAAKILTFELIGDVSDTKKNALDAVVAEYAEKRDIVDFSKLKVTQNLDKLSIVFGLKDNLLRSAGSIPAFYWFVRSLEIDRLRLVRPFLEQFYSALSGGENELERSMQVDVAEYRRALRSVNDKWSHSLRVEILNRRFAHWHDRYLVSKSSSQI
jgi:hypothetical protein